MKTKHPASPFASRYQLSAINHQPLASVVSWSLLCHLDGRYELRGGSPDDRRAARKRISMFLHVAVFTHAL